jgi:3-oxoadipate enol-lactonase
MTVTFNETLAYETHGPLDGPPLLLIHALGMSMRMWDPQVAAWSTRFRVVRCDLRGHGGSAVSPGEYSLGQLGRDALALLDALGIERTHVCGLSLGGQVAMWLALHVPSRVDRIVLANTAARLGTVEMWHARIAQVQAEGLTSLAVQGPARWFTSRFIAAHPDRVRDYQLALLSCDPAGYIGCCAALRDTDLRAELPHIAAPALVITGAHDPSTPPADGHALGAALPNAVQHELDAAHFSNVECANDFATAVSAFLSGNRPRCDGDFA